MTLDYPAEYKSLEAFNNTKYFISIHFKIQLTAKSTIANIVIQLVDVVMAPLVIICVGQMAPVPMLFTV